MTRHGSFEVLRRRYFDAPLGRYGFRPFRPTMLGRVVGDWVLQLVVLRPDKWGEAFGVTCAARPLFASPTTYPLLQPGNGLGDFLEADGCARVDWWSRQEHDVRSAFRALWDHAMPWLDVNRDAPRILAARAHAPHPWWNEPELVATLGHVLLRARRRAEAMRTFDTMPPRVPHYTHIRDLARAGAWQRIDALHWRYISDAVRTLRLQPLLREAA